MSIEAMSAVLHHSKASGATLVIALGIANHQGDGGAYPSRATLARYGRCSERYVKLAIQQLINLGELVVQDRAGRNGTNVYIMSVPCPPDCDRTTNHRPVQGGNYASPGGNYASKGGELHFPSGGNHASPKPSYNLKLTKDNFNEKELARLDREQRLAQTEKLREEMAEAKAKAEPMPNCKHNKPLLQCIPCCKELESEKV
jgi:hypothetical protein